MKKRGIIMTFLNYNQNIRTLTFNLVLSYFQNNNDYPTAEVYIGVS